MEKMRSRYVGTYTYMPTVGVSPAFPGDEQHDFFNFSLRFVSCEQVIGCFRDKPDAQEEYTRNRLRLCLCLCLLELAFGFVVPCRSIQHDQVPTNHLSAVCDTYVKARITRPVGSIFLVVVPSVLCSVSRSLCRVIPVLFVRLAV